MAIVTGAKRDIHQTVTDRIVQQIETGTAPWLKPWTSAQAAVRPLRSTGQPYNGVNVLTLWLDAEEKGFSSPYWFGFQTAIKSTRSRGLIRRLFFRSDARLGLSRGDQWAAGW